VLAATATRGLRLNRLIFQDCSLVMKYSSSPATPNPTGVGTPVPSRLKVVIMAARLPFRDCHGVGTGRASLPRCALSPSTSSGRRLSKGARFDELSAHTRVTAITQLAGGWSPAWIMAVSRSVAAGSAR
jgi:hypothetical protein